MPSFESVRARVEDPSPNIKLRALRECPPPSAASFIVDFRSLSPNLVELDAASDSKV